MFWDDRNYDALENYDTVTGTSPGAVEGSPVYVPDSEMPAGNQDNGLTVMDMRGKDYYDENWDLLLNQINWEGEKEAIEEIVTNSNAMNGEVIGYNMPIWQIMFIVIICVLGRWRGGTFFWGGDPSRRKKRARSIGQCR